MHEAVPLDLLQEIARVGGSGALLFWVFMWLLRRSDRLQRENIGDLRDQRDYWRERAERAEARISVLEERLDHHLTEEQ